MIAIWTDADDVVTRQHYRPEQLDDNVTSDAFLVESIPDDSAGPGEDATLHYTEADGFWYTYTSYPTRLRLPNGDGEALLNAVSNGDQKQVIDLFEKHTR